MLIVASTAGVALFLTMLAMVLLDQGEATKIGPPMLNIFSGAKFIVEGVFFPLVSLLGIGLGTAIKDMGKKTSMPRVWLAIAISIWSMHGAVLGFGMAVLMGGLVK